MKKALLFILIFVLGIGSYCIYKLFEKKEYNYLIVDINPSIQLTLDKNDKVVEVTPLNSDGDILISELKLKKLSLEEAAKIIIKEAVEMGYIYEYGVDNYVTVLGYSKVTEKITKLEDTFIRETKIYLNSKYIYNVVKPFILNDESKRYSEENNISSLNMKLIEKIIELDKTIKKEELISYNSKELYNKIKVINNNRLNNLNIKEEELKEKKNLLKQETQNKINKLIEEIREENKDRIDPERDFKIQELLRQKKEEIRKTIKNID